MKQASISNINRVIGMLYSLSFCVTSDDVRTVLGFAIEHLENTLESEDSKDA